MAEKFTTVAIVRRIIKRHHHAQSIKDIELNKLAA